MSYTHTYAKVPVSKATFDEIKGILVKAGYSDQIHEHKEHSEVIDMHGLALVVKMVECHACSEAGGADRGVFHEDPPCPPIFTEKEVTCPDPNAVSQHTQPPKRLVPLAEINKEAFLRD